MSEMNDKIVNLVNDSIGQLRKVFLANPTYFYTEGDLVSHLFHLLLKNIPDSIMKICDCDNKEHLIIHREYPTPEKLDMSSSNCVVMKDNSKHKRGHYDIVIMNPEFIKNSSYDLIKGQKFKECKNTYMSFMKEYNQPVILYALEFMYRRDPLNSVESEKEFWGKIRQDAKKLALFSNEKYKFISNAEMIAFIKGTKRDRWSYIQNEAKKDQGIDMNIIWEDDE